MQEKAKEMAKLAWQALDDKKGNDIHIIDISKVSVIADYFIIANGENRNQVQAMSDNVEETLGRAGYEPKQIEGYAAANWILLDYGDIVVHIFSADDRRFFNLERIWQDGVAVSPEEI